MKKALLLLLMVSLSLAGGTFTETQLETQTEAAGLEIAQSWQLLAVMALMVSIILVAIAYMIGIGFELPAMRAWAGSELAQIFANAIIILALVGTIVFLDVIVSAMVLDSGLPIPECSDPTKSCLNAVADSYLDDYVETAKNGAKSVLYNNIQASGMANRRAGVYCLTIYCLQLGVTTTVAGHYVLDVDMYAILFEYYTNLLASLEAQKFFVDQVCFKIGPLILAIGIVARSFFFTRKLGGLLIAIAAGLMFFFPGMYIFDWITMDMAMTGDKALADEEILCPPECGIAPPLAYVDGGENLVTIAEVYAAFSSEDAYKAQGILNGTRETEVGSAGNASGKAITSCYHGPDADCPSLCRELPYPYASPLCINVTAQKACAAVDEKCKIKRLVNTSAETFDIDEYNRCPSSCKVVPPLKSDCDEDECLESRFDCRVYKRKGPSLEWWPNPPEGIGNYDECEKAQDCPANFSAELSCVYVVPEIGRCDELEYCADCPPHCRVKTGDWHELDDDCMSGIIPGLPLIHCMLCTESCKVNVVDIENLDPPPGECDACPPERRLVHSALPDNYTTGVCSLEQCPKDYRLPVPRSSCEMCLFSEESYIYDPPIQTGCSDLCSPSDNTPVKESGSYTKIGEDGLVGREEIKGVSKLMLPAYLLPLFNIVATLIFMKGLSSILGGDIEIPGLSKVF